MKDKKLLSIIPLLILAVMISACGASPGGNVEDIAVAEAEVQEAEAAVEEPVTEGTGFCSNEFYPLRSDKVWEYSISDGNETNPYSITFKDITDTSFTTLQTFTSLTNEVGWMCDENGLLSNTFANMNLSGADIAYETLEVDGVALPPDDEWQIGKSWDLAYNVEVTISSGGMDITAEGEIIIASQIVAIESITVPSGTYDEAYRVDSNGEMVVDVMGTQTSTPLTYSDWYVRGVGLVKSASDEPDLYYSMELVSFQ